MTNRVSSGQIQGQFNALRITRSFQSTNTVDIASGRYGNGKFFPGATNLSDPDWAGATNTFFVYLDSSDSLILNGSNFPSLCTCIAQIELVSGAIVGITDSRSEVNSYLDAYQVAFNDTNLSIATPSDNVQDAIEHLDAYVSSINDFLGVKEKYVDLAVDGGVKNGLVRVGEVDDVPVLEFVKRSSGLAKVTYTSSVPSDWIEGTDITVRIFWSTASVDTGDINWQINYRLLTSGVDLVDLTKSTLGFVQSAPGVVNRLLDTSSNLFIASNNISAGDILSLSIGRNYSVSDTFASSARVHLIRLEYTGS